MATADSATNDDCAHGSVHFKLCTLDFKLRSASFEWNFMPEGMEFEGSVCKAPDTSCWQMHLVRCGDVLGACLEPSKVVVADPSVRYSPLFHKFYCATLCFSDPGTTT